MADSRRHLHELEPGAAFEFPGSGTVSRLLAVAPGRCEISDPSPPETVQFEALGRSVEFERPNSGSRPCSPYALVRPI